jgi:nucleoside-diphosphate-sugar epimerase
MQIAGAEVVNKLNIVEDNSKRASIAESSDFIVAPNDRILVTGAAGFIGSRVVEMLISRGFRNLLCFTKPSTNRRRIEEVLQRNVPGANIELIEGNLLSKADCEAACKDVSVILHLAAGMGGKSFPDVFMNTVVCTRNLLEASVKVASVKRFLLVSSFTVYTNRQRSRRLDESCPIETNPKLRGSAYCFAKVKQEAIVRDYGETYDIPFVIVRPGSVYGPDNPEITSRVGLNTFGLFLHLGGSNSVPFTYVDNCADAIVLAGVMKGVDGEVFNIVDDEVPSSRKFLRLYKRKIRNFKSIYLPHAASYALCYLWERYSEWSHGQLPPVFNRRRWSAEWRRTLYSNQKLKDRLRWNPRVPTAEAMELCLKPVGRGTKHA